MIATVCSHSSKKPKKLTTVMVSPRQPLHPFGLRSDLVLPYRLALEWKVLCS